MIFFQKGYEGRERTLLQLHCSYNNIPIEFGSIGDDLPLGFTPVGSVEFVEHYIGQRKPNYLPDWCRNFVSRKIYETPPISEKCFIKPSDRYKAFEGFVGEVSERCENLICTEVVEFVDEWRMYIVDGQEVACWWYSGKELSCENLPNGLVTEFNIPKGFCGTLDYGLLSDGALEIVECHHPYAIGWYGEMTPKDGESYFKFITKGYKSLTNK